jgi:nicotinate-nucleotide adenylyltransferase
LGLSNIAIYGGTFDPIHHAHLILAREAQEQLELDEVIFVPAAASPHKTDVPSSDANVRLEMTIAAVNGERGFTADDREVRRAPPSFAIDTVEQIRTERPTARLFYLIGEDNVGGLATWKRFSELQQLVELIVLDRSGLKTDHRYRSVRRHIDISSTDIRNRVATGRSIRYLVPPSVEELIRRHHLYREPQHHA